MGWTDMDEPSSFRWLPEECHQGIDDPYMLQACELYSGQTLGLGENTIKIAKNDPFIECLRDLHMISF